MTCTYAVFGVLRLTPYSLRLTVSIALCAMLTACGFHLRGRASLPFDTLYIAAPETSAFGLELKRAVTSGSATQIAAAPEKADAVLRILGEQREKQILSLSTDGRVREFQLRYRISYLVEGPKNIQFAGPSEISLTRDFVFNDAQVLAKETEEAQLYRDMQSDAVQQLVRRLAALKASASRGVVLHANRLRAASGST
jgi:LPS-assembly lipoprotein